jgi:hypothetical protein
MLNTGLDQCLEQEFKWLIKLQKGVWCQKCTKTTKTKIFIQQISYSPTIQLLPNLKIF